MNCRQCEEKISDYVAGHLDLLEEARLADHCAACTACTRSLESERSFRRLFTEAEPVLHSPDLWSQVSLQLTPRKKRFVVPRLWRVSSGFVLTTMAAAALVLTFLPKPSVVAPVDSNGKTVVKKPPLAPATTIYGGAPRVGVDESEYVYNQTRVAYQVGFALPEEGQH